MQEPITGGVGLVGLSNGGTLALALAAQLGQKVKAVVSISGYPMLIGCSLASHTMTIPGYPVDLEPSKGSCYSQFLAIFTSKDIWKIGSPWTIPVEHVCCPVPSLWAPAWCEERLLTNIWTFWSIIVFREGFTVIFAILPSNVDFITARQWNNLARI